MQISQKGLILISLPLIFELGVFGMLSYQLGQSEIAINQQVQSREVMALDDQVQRAYTCSLVTTFLYAGTHIESFKLRQEQATNEVLECLLQMRKRFIKNQQDPYSIGQSARLLVNILRQERNWRTMDLSKWFVPARKYMVKRMMFLHKRRFFSGLMEKEQRLSRKVVKERLESVSNTYWMIGASLIFMICLAFWLGQYFISSIAVRLLNVMQNTINLAGRQALNLPVSGNDEIAMLDKSVYRSAAEILELEHYRAQLTAIISHELKTPLSSLRLVLMMLSQGTFGMLSSPATLLLNEAVYESEMLIDLIQNILLLERIESGVFTPESKEVNIAAVVAKAVEPLRSVDSQQKFKIEVAEVSGTVWTDEEALSRSLRCGLLCLFSCIAPDSYLVLEFSSNETEICITAKAKGTLLSAPSESKLSFLLSKSLQEKLGAKWEFDSSNGTRISWQVPRIQQQLKDQALAVLPIYSQFSKSTNKAGQISRPRFGFNMMLKEKGMILVLVPILFVITSLGLFSYIMQQADSELNKQFRARDILSEVAKAELLKWDALSTASLRAVYSDDNEIADQYERDNVGIESSLSKLAQMAKEDPDHTRFVQLYTDICRMTLKASDALVVSGLNDFSNVVKITEELKNYCKIQGFKSDNPWSAEDEMIRNEQQHLERSVAANAHKRQTLQSILNGMIFLSIIIALGLVIYFNKTMIRDINNIVQNAQRLLKNEALNPPLPGTDEIAILDGYFYKVAQKLMTLRAFKQSLVSVLREEFMKPLDHIQQVLTQVSQVEEGMLSQKAQARISLGQKELKRLTKLVDELLSIEKMQVGKIELQATEVNLGEIMDRSGIIARPLADDKRIKLQINSLNLTFPADSDRLIQVLVNLLSNAIKFSPEDAVVTLNASISGNILELRVTDQGRGIPQILLGKIFEPFEQVEKSDASEKKGTGLGLFIVKSIIEAHQGTIGVESEEGKGASFWIHLPLPLVHPATV